MESNKYYTPSLEEFKVGFLYQKQSRFKDSVWMNKEVKRNEMLTHLHDCAVKGAVRVKYLDTFDIVTLLRFSEIAEGIFSRECSTPASRSEHIKIVTGNRIEEIQILDGTNQTLFKGVILNVSRLKEQLINCQVEIL
jgi:hypothetical protein